MILTDPPPEQPLQKEVGERGEGEGRKRERTAQVLCTGSAYSESECRWCVCVCVMWDKVAGEVVFSAAARALC